MAADLNFCKNCGARNERNAQDKGNSSAGWIAFAAMLLGGIGLFGFYPILRELLRSPLETPAVVVLMIAYLVAVLAMFSILVAQIRRTGDSNRKRVVPQVPDLTQRAPLRSATTAQLEGPREAPASVTEHTTRTLEEIPR